MLGIRGDQTALPLITSSLSDNDQLVRKEASAAIVKINGAKSVNALIDYMLKFSNEADQEAAKSALMTDSEQMTILISCFRF